MSPGRLAAIPMFLMVAAIAIIALSVFSGLFSTDKSSQRCAEQLVMLV